MVRKKADPAKKKAPAKKTGASTAKKKASAAAEPVPAVEGIAPAVEEAVPAAESAEEKRFFEALLAEYFGGENQPPHKSSSSAESRAELSVPASENGASQRTNK